MEEGHGKILERQGLRQRGWLEGEPTYQEWMLKEGIPVYEAFASIEDITELVRKPWARMGGKGCFIEMEGTVQGRELLYMVEIPPGGALEPEKHIYDEVIYILKGRGSTEVWQEGEENAKRIFEWGEESVFAMPLNVWHRLVNGGREPVLIFAMTGAPLVMDAVRNAEFVFNCPYKFTDRYKGESDYFQASEKIVETEYLGVRGQPSRVGHIWETNFIPNMATAFLGDHLTPQKIAGGLITNISMTGWFGEGSGLHSSEWPTGRYHKAHFHGPSAILMGRRSKGYVLLWHRQWGIHPFQDGHEDKVIKVPWGINSIYCPPTEWYHAHFNTGTDSARHLAIKGGGVGTGMPSIRKGGSWAGASVRDGGSLIEYEDEDPEVRRMFKEELKKVGIEFAMEPVVYRTDTAKVPDPPSEIED